MRLGANALAACVLACALPAIASISFTQPITSGTYNIGSQMIIGWTYTDANFTNPVTVSGVLYLEKGANANSMEILSVIDNLNTTVLKSGRYYWTIPTTLATNSGYALRLTAGGNTYHTPTFTIYNPAQPANPSPPPPAATPLPSTVSMPAQAATTTTQSQSSAPPGASAWAGALPVLWAGFVGVIIGAVMPRYL